MTRRDAILSGIAKEGRLDLVVTPKSMDDELDQLVHVMGRALNLALHPGYPERLGSVFCCARIRMSKR